jgi:hypothetical protein
MKSAHFKRTGLVLILGGIAGVGMTAVGMMKAYREQADISAPALAEGISSSLIPASIGAPLVLAGLILVLVGWWRGRRSRRSIELRGGEQL